MRCTLVNHSYVNEIQTITQLFFPNARFTFSQDAVNPADRLGYSVCSTLDGDVCAASVYRDGTLLTSYSLPVTPALSIKRLLMLALFNALKKSVDAYTPWGALTGIRPSKLVRQWLAEGKDDRYTIDTLTQTYQCHENKARLALTVAHAENRLDTVITTQAAQVAPGKIPMGLYISVPYCPSRCLYCSFNTSHKPAAACEQAAYLAALAVECAETVRIMEEMKGVFTSVYIGGGTPTVLSEMLLEELLSNVTAFFGSCMPGAEYTVEAGRPDSLSPAKLRILKEHGVNRIAVNPQSLNDRTLTLIGRNHTAKDFYTAFEAARKAGFNNINTDVIAGLPGEGTEDMRRTMEGLAALSPENITVHTLAVKRASRLNEHRSEYTSPGAAEIETMLSMAQKVCEDAGLLPYYLYRQKNMVGLFENVGYSKPGYECLYNIGMMAETQTVLAVGAGAVTKYVNGSQIDRSFNVKNAEVYIERMITQAPKGTRDIYGDEMRVWRHMEKKIYEITAQYGYHEIRTPVIEHTELFQRGVGDTTDVVQKEMYSFTDKGGRALSLRPELTAGVARAYVENGMHVNPQPTKLFYIGPNFRYEKPQTGRYRQHYQFGVEVFGAHGVAAEAELITLAHTLLSRLHVTGVTLHINSIGCPECRKVYQQRLKDFLGENFHALCPTCQTRFEKNPLRTLDCKVEACKALLKNAPSVLDSLDDECRAHFASLQALLTELDIPYIVDSKVVRGLDYYTRTVFEFIGSDGLTVIAGGRYDGLIAEIGGTPTAAAGFGMGMDRLAILLKQAKEPGDDTVCGADIFIGYMGGAGGVAAQKLTYTLRSAGIAAECDLLSRSVKAQMKYADKIKARHTLIIGDDEIASGKAVIKDMQSGNKETVLLNDISGLLKILQGAYPWAKA